MPVHHAKVCAVCERDCPEWADRCPACGSLSLERRFIIVPASAAAVKAAPVRKGPSRRRRAAGREPPRPHGAPAHSTA
jgi:predicted amidophosphoribosyltransferase